MCPYKAQLLAQIEDHQQRLQAQKEQQKEKRKMAQQKKREDLRASSATSKTVAEGASPPEQDAAFDAKVDQFIRVMTGKHPKGLYLRK